MRYLILAMLLLLALAACERAPQVSSFEECAEAGYPVMESYPRQCSTDEQTFIENIKQTPEFFQCTQNQMEAEFCTLEYAPVCGMVDNGIRCVTTPCPSTDAQTFSNVCAACTNEVYGYYPGSCESQTFVVCQETATGFSPEDYAKDVGGICVDVCPGNYDAFTTQTGIELCIMHYGDEQITQWNTCKRSSADCDCVKAYETTKGESIDDAKYRCVPEMYSERLLFRAGIDRLDKNGEQSVLIA